MGVAAAEETSCTAMTMAEASRVGVAPAETSHMGSVVVVSSRMGLAGQPLLRAPPSRDELLLRAVAATTRSRSSDADRPLPAWIELH